MTSRTLLPLAAMALALSSAALASPPRPAPPGVVPSTRALTGTTWSIVRIDGKAPASPRAEVRLLQGRISATAGCNGLGGTWRIERGRLVGGPFVSTMMFCEGLMEQERQLADTLGERPEIRMVGNRMALKSAAHAIELVRRRP